MFSASMGRSTHGRNDIPEAEKAPVVEPVSLIDRTWRMVTRQSSLVITSQLAAVGAPVWECRPRYTPQMYRGVASSVGRRADIDATRELS